MNKYIATFLITSLGANLLVLVFAGAAAGNGNYGGKASQLFVLGALDLVCIALFLNVGITLHKRGRENWANFVGLIPVLLLPVLLVWLWLLTFTAQ